MHLDNGDKTLWCAMEKCCRLDVLVGTNHGNLELVTLSARMACASLLFSGYHAGSSAATGRMLPRVHASVGREGISFEGVPTYIEDVDLKQVLGSLDGVAGDFFEVVGKVAFTLPSRPKS